MTLQYTHASPHEYILRTYMGNRLGTVNADYWVQESVITKDAALTQFEWVNVNLMVKFSFFCEINIYRGVDYRQMAPRYTQYFKSIGAVSSMVMKAYIVPAGKGVYLGEIRAFKQYTEMVDYGYWTRFYKVSVFPEAFTALHQEIYVSATGILYLDKADSSKQLVFSTSNTLPITWIHCEPGFAPTSTTQCGACTEAGCLFCPTGDDDDYD